MEYRVIATSKWVIQRVDLILALYFGTIVVIYIVLSIVGLQKHKVQL